MGFLATLKRWFGLSSGPLELKAGDKLLVCEDCGNQFVFDAGEQVFFKEKGFSEPKRCPTCRKQVRRRMRRRGRGGRGRGNGEGGDNGNQQQPRNDNNKSNHHNQSKPNNNRGNRDRHHGRRHRRDSVIDGDSPYADER